MQDVDAHALIILARFLRMSHSDAYLVRTDRCFELICGDVSIRGSGNSTLRSSVLREILRNSAEGEAVQLRVPSHQMQAWLAHVNSPAASAREDVDTASVISIMLVWLFRSVAAVRFVG